ncbi:MAG: hypothetical protein DMF80_05520 [Acidobacteria bacterium]|nr:MAG: hypothetical protein DMF80_05520 [Acidobacteriota bacterium]
MLHRLAGSHAAMLSVLAGRRRRLGVSGMGHGLLRSGRGARRRSLGVTLVSGRRFRVGGVAGSALGPRLGLPRRGRRPVRRMWLCDGSAPRRPGRVLPMHVRMPSLGVRSVASDLRSCDADADRHPMPSDPLGLDDDPRSGA